MEKGCPNAGPTQKGSRHNGRFRADFRADSGCFGLFQVFRIAWPGPQNCPDGAHRTLIADLRPAWTLHHACTRHEDPCSTMLPWYPTSSSEAHREPAGAPSSHPRLAGIWEIQVLWCIPYLYTTTGPSLIGGSSGPHRGLIAGGLIAPSSLLLLAVLVCFACFWLVLRNFS